jgi:HK97 family phage portal protein
MAVWDRIMGAIRPKATTQAAANTWPVWEQTSPQYPQPSPYALAVSGYRRNEIIYACIQKRAVAVAAAPLAVYDSDGDVLDDSPARELIAKPNSMMSEAEFWQAVEIYLCVAGYSVWEIEFSRGGDPLALWPMRPDWCSFLRGPDRPLATVRYQPQGLPYVDIDISRCIVFQEFDPLYPMLKGLSKSAVAMRVAATDNAATDFLTSFFQRGAQVSGILSTTANVNDAEAKRIRDRWRELHGGTANWGDIAVLGAGVQYQNTQMSFREMDFTNLDGRDEARMCAVFGVPPMLIGAKVGLSASTYSNYQEARKAFYEEAITPRWQYLAGEIESQLVPHFADGIQGDVPGLWCGFDTSGIKALQEDRTAAWTRALQAASAGVITRDEARAEMGLDEIDEVPVFVSMTAPAVGEETEEAEEMPPALAQAQAQQEPAAAGEVIQAEGEAAEEPEPEDEPDEERMKAWRRQALDARRAGQAIPVFGVPGLDVALAGAKSAGEVRAAFDAAWPKAKGASLDALVAEIRAARVALEADRGSA